MPAIGITGGVATGKSSFVRALMQHCRAELFDADACVHSLLASVPALRDEIRAAFGSGVIAADGTVHRPALREIVFNDEDARRELEALVHPHVSASWMPLASRVKGKPEIHLFDIPLLYETKAEEHFDRVLVVACSPPVQRLRLQENRSLASDLIERILGAQIDLPAKVAAADQVVWNDGSPAALDAQARLFAAYLHHYYG